MESMNQPLVFNLQRFSTHDGPGIRTVVFFKGCPLSCAWCENPESQSAEAEILHDLRRCVGCEACLAPGFGAAMRRIGQAIMPDRSRPVPQSLTGVCPSLALRVAGQALAAAAIVAEVRKDEAFYRQSGGGVTFSGGEPLLHPELLGECIGRLQGLGIPVAIETCLAVDSGVIEPFLAWGIHWLLDLKHVDAAAFRRGTGGDSALVLANIRRVAASARALTFRIPVIPGFNDDEASMNGIYDFIAGLERPSDEARRLDYLTFLDLAAGKYALLGRPDPYGGQKLDPKTMALWREAARARHFQTSTGG